MVHIIIFGDSIAQGFWDIAGGWVQRLRAHFDSITIKGRSYVAECPVIFNCSVSGDTTEDVLKRFDTETKARLNSKEKNIIVFSIGYNDAVIDIKKKRTIISESQFSRNLKSLIIKASKYADTIVFTGLLPVDEEKVNPMPWAPELSQKNEHIRKFDAIIKHFCDENNVPFIELYSIFSRNNPDKLLEDGSHPNEKGHELICKEVLGFLEKKNIMKI